MKRNGWFWLGTAIVVGALLPAIFAGWLQWPRRAVVTPLLLGEGLVLAGWFASEGMDWWALAKRRWAWGLLAGVIAGALTVFNVLQQPPSEGPSGAMRLVDLVWLGVIYGLIDALLLTVLPVEAAWRALTDDQPVSRRRALAVGAVALLASMAVTAAYHLGYPEFRGAAVIGPLIGNAIFTLAYLFTWSPIAPVLAHVAMHIAAVLYAFNTAVQLPPHY